MRGTGPAPAEPVQNGFGGGFGDLHKLVGIGDLVQVVGIAGGDGRDPLQVGAVKKIGGAMGGDLRQREAHGRVPKAETAQKGKGGAVDVGWVGKAAEGGCEGGDIIDADIGGTGQKGGLGDSLFRTYWLKARALSISGKRQTTWASSRVVSSMPGRASRP